jgi:hypothetical protein
MASGRSARRGADHGKTRPRGLAKATRTPVFIERTHRMLSRGAEELIFEHADVLSEGAVDEAGGVGTYFGSTMITVDLAALRHGLRDLDAPGMLDALRDAVEASPRMRLRAMRVACAEVSRQVPERVFGTAQLEVRVSLLDGRLHLDVDIEMPLAMTTESLSQ